MTQRLTPSPLDSRVTRNDYRERVLAAHSAAIGLQAA